jgi:hypothetical protein
VLFTLKDCLFCNGCMQCVGICLSKLVCEVYIHPSTPLLKIHSLLDTEHVHSVWVVDAVSYRGGGVSNDPPLPACL